MIKILYVNFYFARWPLRIKTLVRITPSAAVVLNSKDKAPYFAYIEVLNTNDKNIDETPSKMLEASLLEENNLSDQKEILSDEEEIYSGNHNAGNAFKTLDSLSIELFFSRKS